LFRALKAKSNTPKYGLLYHSAFIGKATGKNKGKISRYLANKCCLASRIDYFLVNVNYFYHPLQPFHPFPSLAPINKFKLKSLR